MKKKIIALLLTATTALGLCACGGSTASTSGDAAGTTESTSQDVAATDNGETYNINMQIVTFGQEYTGITDVENAINAIVEPEIGVTVTLEPVAAWDLSTQSALNITSGTKLDLMCILPMASGLDSISNYTSKNMIMPLDDLYAQYGADIDASVGSLIELGFSGGNLYAIPVNRIAGQGYSFVARTDILEELNITIDNEKLYTPSELEEIFAAYKDAYGDGFYPIASFDKSNDFGTLNAIDNFGDYANGAVINDLTSTTVVNPYASQEFSDYLDIVRGWYTKGYYNPDAVTITDAWTTLVSGGNYLGAFTAVPGDGMDALPQNEGSCGYDLTPIHVVEDYATTGGASYALWSIPVTCENPEKVMQFLNILYQDRELANDVDSILACGIEGSSYKVTESLGRSKAIVTFADGVDYMSCPYQQAIPIYGDQMTTPQWAPLTADIYDEYAAYNGTLEKNNKYSAAFGYSFDSTSVSAQKSAVQSVISQYEAILVHGSVDPAEVLPEFLSALDAAGYQEVIEENQKQLDAWLASK